MNIKEIINLGIKKLKESNIDDSILITKLLLSNILCFKKEELIINYEKEIEKDVEKEFLEGINKISKGYPLQYIIGKKEFMKMEFFVNEDVLIPRIDTEILVEETIELAKGKKDILELCTGSGCISISLANYTEVEKIIATDVSKKAIEIAKKNNEQLTKSKKIKFLQSDMFKNINEKFDIIVSNPPYIKTHVIDKYSLKYEPKLALDRWKRWAKILQNNNK